MTPSLRKRNRQHFPKCGDAISVLWKNGSEEVWWSAHVITIQPKDGEDILATGCILYERSGEFNEEMAEVEFIFTSRNGVLLRDVTTSDPGTSGMTNLGKGISSSKKVNSMRNTCSWIYTRDLKDHVPKKCLKTTIIEDEQHTKNIGHEEHPNRESLTMSPSSTVLRENRIVLSNDITTGSMLPSSALNNVSPLSQIAMSSSMIFVNVISELRISLLLQFQSKFKPGNCLNSGDEYMVIKPSVSQVSCTLDSFVSICRHVKFNIKSVSPTFFPSSVFDHVSLATDVIKLSFNTFRELCIAIGIHDYRDFAELICKQGVEKYRNYLRIVGTSSSDDNMCKRDSIYVGSNINAIKAEKSQQVVDKVNRVSRSRTNWSALEGRFLSTWSLETVSVMEEYNSLTGGTELDGPEAVTNKTTTAIQMNDNSQNSDGIVPLTRTPWSQTFDLTWKRSVLPSTRIWTRDALRTGDVVFGRLQACIPTVIVTGEKSCSKLLPIIANINYSSNFNEF